MGEPFASSTSPSSSRREELWKGPPPPPDAQQVAKDLSCQGIIGFTLKEALEEIVAEQELEQEQIIDQPNLNSTATATEEDETESNQNDDNASEPEVLAQTPLVRVDQSMVTSILQAFGKSVAHSQQERYSQQQKQQQQQQQRQQRQGTAATTATASVESPAALLKGRLKHYNRRNTKWRIVLRDVDFQRRRPLDKNRRKRERPSLWQVGREQQQQQQDGNGNGNTGESASTPTIPTQTTTNSSTSNCTLEILAYNDLE
jgi:hypothetical protein